MVVDYYCTVVDIVVVVVVAVVVDIVAVCCIEALDESSAQNIETVVEYIGRPAVVVAVVVIVGC